MNLGSFAGGLSQGYEQQQRLNMQQQELDQNAKFRDRQLKMQEQEASAQQDARDRAATLRQKSAALVNDYMAKLKALDAANDPASQATDPATAGDQTKSNLAPAPAGVAAAAAGAQPFVDPTQAAGTPAPAPAPAAVAPTPGAPAPAGASPVAAAPAGPAAPAPKAGNLGGGSAAQTSPVPSGNQDRDALSADFYGKHAALVAENSDIAPEKLDQIAQQFTESMKSKRGQVLFKAMYGQQDGIAALAKEMGKDPLKAKANFQPAKGIMELDWGDGTKLDLRGAFAFQASAAQNAQVKELIAEAQANALHNSTINLHAAQIKDSESQGRLRDAQATAVPSEINKNNAAANKDNAYGGYLAASKQGMLDERLDKLSLERINSTFKDELNQTVADGKTMWNAPKVFIEEYVLGKQAADPKANRAQIQQEAFSKVTEATGAATKTLTGLVSQMRSNPDAKAKVKAQFGTTDPAAIRQQLIEMNLKAQRPQ